MGYDDDEADVLVQFVTKVFLGAMVLPDAVENV